MYATAVAAAFAAGSIQIQEWWLLERPYAAALRDYSNAKKQYAKGRLGFWTLVAASQRLMEAELRFATRRKQRLLSISSHLYRVSNIIDEEIKHPGSALTAWPAIDTDTTEAVLKGAQVKWGTWIDATDGNDVLDTCKSKLDRLRAEAQTISSRVRH
jgi:hypothetical protein